MPDEIGVTSLKQEIKTIIDTELGTAITFRQVTARTFAPTTGVIGTTKTDHSLNAIMSKVNVEDMEANGDLVVTDLAFIVSRLDLTIEPSGDDQIIEGSDTYTVLSWRTDEAGAMYAIYARK